MLKPSRVAEVKRLRAIPGHSYRRISRLTGISRGTIGKILSGKRPNYEYLGAQRAVRDALDPEGPSSRCPTCGGMVVMPCRACIAREALKQAPRAPRRTDDAEEIRLDLKPEHEARYDPLHEAKMRDDRGEQIFQRRRRQWRQWRRRGGCVNHG